MISESRIDIQFFVISVCGSELGYLWEKKRAAMVQVFLFWGQASRICLGKVHGKSWSRLDVQSILQATHFSPSLFLASSSPKKKLESNQQKKTSINIPQKKQKNPIPVSNCWRPWTKPTKQLKNPIIRACLSGFDWVEAADSLRPIGLIWVNLFHVYVAFCSLLVSKKTRRFASFESAKNWENREGCI